MHCVLACAIALCALLGVGTAAPQERPVGLLSTVQAGGCSGYCGGYSSTGSCYCDDLCTSYGDCCTDYLDVCSCSGHCGGSAISCYCDDLCTGYQDCCHDYEQLCTSPPPSFEQFVIFSKNDGIYRVELDGSGLQKLISESGGRPWGVDFDIREDYLYWADVNQNTVKRSRLDGTNIETLLTLGTGTTSSIAVDWINKKVYYNDGNDIGVYHIGSGTNEHLLTTEQLARPLSLAVDPINGYLYWTEGGYATGEQYKRVVRAFADGTGREELHNTGLLDPEGLSVDHSNQKMYWGDPLTSKIERSNADGSNRETVLSTSYPTSTAVLGDTMYYTENLQYAILAYNLQTQASQTIHQEPFGSLLNQLTVVSVDRQPEVVTSAGLVSSRPFPAPVSAGMKAEGAPVPSARREEELLEAAVNNGRHSMVGSRPPPESDMVSASMRHETAVNNGRHSMVGSRPPPESDMVSASMRHETAFNNPMVDSRPPPDMAVQAGGCSGYCGGYSSSGSCYCDNLCTTYGDCCADYLDVCNPIVAIESVPFANVYLRMDGNGVTGFAGPGAGTVNCQYGIGPWEKFRIRKEDVGYSFESVNFAGVYLRMDGNGVTSPQGPGAGVVNCQYGVGPWEKFHLRSDVKEIYSIESVQFSGVFLRMDGGGVTQPTGPGGGIVNCQYGAFPYEMFRLHFL